MVTAITAHKLKENERQNAAIQIIADLDQYKDDNRQYPETLDKLKSKDHLPDISYYIDSTKQKFTVSYNLDGWHRKVYDSQIKKWTVRD